LGSQSKEPAPVELEQALTAAKARQKSGELDAKVDQARTRRDETAARIGNIVPNDTPEVDSVVSTWGQLGGLGLGPPLRQAVEILIAAGLIDEAKGVEVSGHGARYLRGEGVLLAQAVRQLGLAHLGAKGYCPLQPPCFLQPRAVENSGITASSLRRVYPRDDCAEGEQRYLLAEGRSPLAMYHSGERFARGDELPKRYVGLASSFPKKKETQGGYEPNPQEEGSHGKGVSELAAFVRDTAQYDTVDCAVLSQAGLGSESEALLEAMVEFYQALELPHRVIRVGGKGLSHDAAREWRVEGYCPGSHEFVLLASCKDSRDFGARLLEIRCPHATQKVTPFPFCGIDVGTLVSTPHVMACMVENYQFPGSVRLPAPLQPFFPAGSILLPSPAKFVVEVRFEVP